MKAWAAVLLPMIACVAPAQAQTLQPPPGEPPDIVPSVGPASPEDLTEPNETIQCDATNLDRRTHRFSLRYSGRRGYLNPATGEAEAMESRLVVVDDSSRLFSGYTRWTSVANGFEGHSDRKEAVFGPQVRIQLERTDFKRDGVTRTTWAVLVQSYFGWMPLTKMVGFCRVDSTPQRPLDQAEVRARLQRR